MTITLKTSSASFRMFSVGTYDGQTACVDNFIDDEAIKDDFEEGYVDYLPGEYWELFDGRKYKNQLVELGEKFLQRTIVPTLIALDIGIISAKAVSLYSPSEYNFSTDALNIDIVVEDNFGERIMEIINNLEPEDKADYAQYLKSKFTSYDGFCSFTSNNIPDTLDEISKDIDCVETIAFLTWYIRHEDSDAEEWNEGWYYLLHENTYAGEFLPEDATFYSRQMVEVFTPLIEEKAPLLYLEGVTGRDAAQQFIDQTEIDDEKYPELYAATDEWALREWVEEQINPIHKNLDEVNIPSFMTFVKAQAESLLPMFSKDEAKEIVKSELMKQVPHPLTLGWWDIDKLVNPLVESIYVKVED